MNFQASLMSQWYKVRLQWRIRGFNPWVGKISCRKEQLPTLVFLPGESHDQRSLAVYSLWGPKESDTTEHTFFQDIHSGLPSTSVAKESAWNAGDLGLILGQKEPLEKEMATYSSILAWRIPWAEETGVGYSLWSHKESDTTEAT